MIGFTRCTRRRVRVYTVGMGVLAHPEERAAVSRTSPVDSRVSRALPPSRESSRAPDPRLDRVGMQYEPAPERIEYGVSHLCNMHRRARPGGSPGGRGDGWPVGRERAVASSPWGPFLHSSQGRGGGVGAAVMVAGLGSIDDRTRCDE